MVSTYEKNNGDNEVFSIGHYIKCKVIQSDEELTNHGNFQIINMKWYCNFMIGFESKTISARIL